MGKYGYSVLKDDKGWYFVLMPCNNHSQPTVRSVSVKDYEECLRRFRTFYEIAVKGYNYLILQHTSFETDEIGRARFYIKYTDVVIAEQPYYVGSKQISKNSIKAICTHLEDYYSNDLCL